MLKSIFLPDFDFALDMKMATLTESHEIPFSAV